MMSPDLFRRYTADPTGLDGEVRKQCGIPDDRYYTVSVWPENLAGRIFVDEKRYRAVKAVKISKSAQP